jgi:hypothetical protein
MKLITLLAFISFGTMMGQKSIQDIECINKVGGTRFVTLMSDNSVWWSIADDSWSEVSRNGLPTDKKIASVHVYLKYGIVSADSTLIAILDDSSMWWFNEGKWELVKNKTIQPGAKVKIMKPYVKFGSFGSTETRFFMLCDDNTLWWAAPEDNYKKIDKSGLPDNLEITNISTYQKFGMMGDTETRYVISLADNTIWWYADGKKWQKVEMDGLPSGYKIVNMTTYLKMSMMSPSSSEGRLVMQLADNTIWWKAAKDKAWRSLEMEGLPKDQKIKNIEIYQKFGGSTGTRIIVLYEDNSIWWYAEKQGWKKYELKNLLK